MHVTARCSCLGHVCRIGPGAGARGAASTFATRPTRPRGQGAVPHSRSQRLPAGPPEHAPAGAILDTGAADDGLGAGWACVSAGPVTRPIATIRATCGGFDAGARRHFVPQACQARYTGPGPSSEPELPGAEPAEPARRTAAACTAGSSAAAAAARSREVRRDALLSASLVSRVPHPLQAPTCPHSSTRSREPRRTSP